MPPDTPPDYTDTIGKFDPSDARRLIALLQKTGIPFQVDVVEKPRQHTLHEGNVIEIFVPEDRVQDGYLLAGKLFPAESPPPR